MTMALAVMQSIISIPKRNLYSTVKFSLNMRDFSLAGIIICYLQCKIVMFTSSPIIFSFQ